MSKRKIIGVEPVNYISKKTGEAVSGLTLYLGSNVSNVFGMQTMDHFVSSKSPTINQFMPYQENCAVLVGRYVDLEYNNRGFCESLTLLDDKAN